MDTGGLTQMTYRNTNTSNGFAPTNLSAPGAGFGGRTRLGNKRLSVALPPKVSSISEHQVDNPTPRTSRSHLLAGLRTQPKSSSVPASAPHTQTQHHIPSMGPVHGGSNFKSTVPQSTTASNFDFNAPYAMSAGRQMYSLPEQVLGPPSLYDQVEDVDPNVLQQMQLTSILLAQRQQQLQQQLLNITAAAQSMSLHNGMARTNFPMTPQTTQSYYPQQQVQEVHGNPGMYLVFNPATQSYSYFVDPSVHGAINAPVMEQPIQQTYAANADVLGANISPPSTERSTPVNGRSITPPKKAPSPISQGPVEPLPPPSANAFRRGHKKASSLAVNAFDNVSDGPKTSSAATFGSIRAAIPPTPMTGTFGPGGARAGEHPLRQPRGPPPLEELVAAPTSVHEGSKNFATRQRRRALDSLMKAGTQRRVVSRSAGGSPASEGDFNFLVSGDSEDLPSVGGGSRKMSPIGSEMKEKRGSQGSNDGYFGLSSASSSESEDVGTYRLPLTPASVPEAVDRKRTMLDMLSASAERRHLFH